MISIDLLKEYMGLGSVDSTAEAFLQVSINVATAKVENYCNRKFTADTYIQYSNGNNKTEMFLDNYPVTSVSSIQYLDSGSTWTDVCDSTGNYFIIPDINKIKLLNGYYFPKGCNNIKITYDAGWNTNEAIADVQEVLLEMSAMFVKNSYRVGAIGGLSRLGLSSENINSQNSTGYTFKNMLPEWKEKLKKYRITKY